jgi:hypothetical protein
VRRIDPCLSRSHWSSTMSLFETATVMIASLVDGIHLDADQQLILTQILHLSAGVDDTAQANPHMRTSNELLRKMIHA